MVTSVNTEKALDRKSAPTGQTRNRRKLTEYDNIWEKLLPNIMFNDERLRCFALLPFTFVLKVLAGGIR